MYSAYNQRGGSQVGYPTTYSNVRNSVVSATQPSYDTSQTVYANNNNSFATQGAAVYNYSTQSQELQTYTYSNAQQQSDTFNSMPAVAGIQTTYSTPYQRPAPFPNFQSRPKPMKRNGGGFGGGRGGRGRGRGRGRGGRGGGGGGPPKVYSCANKHPVAALKNIRPDATFETVCEYQCKKGSAMVVSTTLDGVTYQGEGTKAVIAKALAAARALEGINAYQHELVEKVADYEEQKEQVTAIIAHWQEVQVEREKIKKEKEERNQKRMEQQQAAKRRKENSGSAAPVTDTPPTEVTYVTVNKPTTDTTSSATSNASEYRDYGMLIQRYGPDIQEQTVETVDRKITGFFQFTCKLTVQGRSFEGEGGSKKSARNNAVERAFRAFDLEPPPIVNARKPKDPSAHDRKRARAEFKVIEPVTFQDKLAEKCWNLVTDKLADIACPLGNRRNFVAVVKVKGAEDPNNLENCELVAFGNGSHLIKVENMTTDGTVIKDSTGESLALRAFRRYLLDQISLCFKSQPSVYIKQLDGKCSIDNAYSFYLYTNSSPMGDCRAQHTPDTPPPAPAPSTPAPSTPAPVVKQEPMEPAAVATGDAATPPVKQEGTPTVRRPPFRRHRRFQTNLEDLGKVTYAKVDLIEGSMEGTVVFDKEKCHSIVSPSDKLALRQMCGVQGSILFNLSNPVYISKYLVGRSYGEENLRRALWERMKGVKVRGSAGLEPQLAKVEWKVTRNPEKRDPWAFLWAKDHALEFIFTPAGKKYENPDLAPVDAKLVDPAQLQQSEYCTKALFAALTKICQDSQLSCANKYSTIKCGKNRYSEVKQAVQKHLLDSGLGSWPEKRVPDY